MSKRKRLFILILGHISVLLGLIGLLLPVMPTSPFIIFASVCYSRTSERFHLMLLRNRYFGSYVRDWNNHRCIQRSAKLAMMAVLVISFSATTAGFVLSNPWQMQTALITLSIIMLAIIAISLLARVPACPSKNHQEILRRP